MTTESIPFVLFGITMLVWNLVLHIQVKDAQGIADLANEARSKASKGMVDANSSARASDLQAKGWQTRAVRAEKALDAVTTKQTKPKKKTRGCGCQAKVL